MEEGFVVDQGYGNRNSKWVAGQPDENRSGLLKIDDKAQYLILTFRCTNCGYLESYANDPE